MIERKNIYLLCIVILLSSFSIYFSHQFYFEDSHITLRYAQRLIEGKGLTWNDGERVEGFSNFFWLLQNALLGYVGFDLESSSRYLGIAYYIAILAVLILVKLPAVLLIPVITLPSLNMYAMSGMETVSFCFWLLAGTALLNKALERRIHEARIDNQPSNQASKKLFVISGLLFTAGALTRPEGVLVGILVLIYLFNKKQTTSALRFAIGFVPPILAYQVFRMLYFHDILPNTYYAKSANISKLILLKSAFFYLAKWSVEWIPIAVLILLVLRRISIKKVILPITISLPVVMAYFLGGGDHMKGIRFLLPAIIVVAYGAGHSLKGRKLSLEKGVTGLTVFVVLVHIFLATVHWTLPIFPMTFGLKPRSSAAAHGEIVGKFLDDNLPARTLLASNDAGTITYYGASLNFIDMLGLNDKIIAKRKIMAFKTSYQKKPGHFKGDGDYVLSRKPDVIFLGLTYGSLGDDKMNLFLSDYEIIQNKGFRENYTPYKIEIPLSEEQREWHEVKRHLENGRYYIFGWLRNDSRNVESLRRIGTVVISKS